MMNNRQFIQSIRDLIAKDDLATALSRLRELLDNTPLLNEVLHQSGRFENIRKQIRLGLVSHSESNLTQNQIRVGLLDLVSEIEIKSATPRVDKELESAVSVVNSKNLLVNSNFNAENITIGDKTEFHQHYGGNTSFTIPANLTTPPFDPPVFLGRDEELITIHDRLFGGDNFLMLVNGQGGIGKTSFAAKYWKKYHDEYKHRAFLYVGNGIENALLSIASELGVNFPDTMTGGERLKLLLKRISQLERPCLIVLDNADEADDLEAHYQLLRTCSNCHLLITSRLATFRGSPLHPIGALSKELGLELFKRHYAGHKSSDDSLFFDIFEAVGGNTLVIELLAKNLEEINNLEVFYSLEKLLNDLQNRGLLRLTEQAAIQVDWQNFEKCRPEVIVGAMYDLRPLTAEDIALLSTFAVLPAENIGYDMLKSLLEPEDIRVFAAKLQNLHQKGWIERNEVNNKMFFKCNPIVQEVVRGKNNRLLEDCEDLISQLNKKLNYEGGTGHFRNATYEEAAIYTHYAESVLRGLENPSYNLCTLYERVGNYHNTTGNLPKALTFFKDETELFKELHDAYPENVSFKTGLTISYERLGQTHTALGNLHTALTFFEERSRLGKELHDAYPENVFFKNGLAISYEKLGQTHTDLGNLPKALTFFEKDIELSKELHDAYPDNVSFKNCLAISYEKLGQTHTALGNLHMALTFFEDETELFKELYDAYPDNVSFKNGLAISYSKLGETHTALGNLHTALTFFEKYIELSKELHDAYPENMSFKNGLAISYEKLGQTHTDLGNLPKALTFFEDETELFKELHDAYPENVSFKNGLAVSYSKLGETHAALGNLPKALTFFEKYIELSKELHDAYPENVSFKNGLAISYSKLGETHTASGNLPKALTFFEKDIELSKELHDAYPENVSFKYGLAISYEKLGDTHTALGNLPTALTFFKDETELFKELHDAYPENVSFKTGLAISYSKLGWLYRYKINESDKAKPYFQKCYDNMKELSEQYPDYQKFRNNLEWAKKQLEL